MHPGKRRPGTKRGDFDWTKPIGITMSPKALPVVECQQGICELRFWNCCFS